MLVYSQKKGTCSTLSTTKNICSEKALSPLALKCLLQKKFLSLKNLFIPFENRIPSRENPAYPDYCKATGISTEETDPLILLTIIAHRGPSSFIFEPLYTDEFTAKDLLEFRNWLGLSVKEFAACFEFSPAAITRTELNQTTGREVA